METRTTDSQARVVLPPAFANSMVVIDQISPTELRVRKAEDPEEAVTFYEETRRVLSDVDRDIFLNLLENPPGPNEALRRLMKDFKT